ncbi:methyltransferase [Desulfobulbus propionicus]|jgi:SAM-dependent methyltransferase
MVEAKTPLLAFSELLTGYRASMVVMLAHRTGLFARLGNGGVSAATLCTQLGWDPAYGRRFLDVLCGLGVLCQEGDRYDFTSTARLLLAPDAPWPQRQTLEFETQLIGSWHRLEDTLKAGRRLFAGGDKSPEELEQARNRYLGAMDEAARVRAVEVWDCLDTLPEQGRLLDLGTGSGAYVRELLTRRPGWSVVCCDLPEILAREELHRSLAPWADRIGWCGCNLLDEGPEGWHTIEAQSCDLVLLSNLIHCQGAGETAGLLRRAAAKVGGQGLLVIHDFFTDDRRGALYDLHMMLNTYNGRTYAVQEVEEMAKSLGFVRQRVHQLPSGSVLLVLARGAAWDDQGA